MFDIGWSELLVLGIVTLIFVGPKELPALMRTLGRYAGMMRRQANEFKAHFDDAMRELELEDMRKEMDAMRDSVNADIMKAQASLEDATKAAAPAASTVPEANTALEQAAPVSVDRPEGDPPRPATPGEGGQG